MNILYVAKEFGRYHYFKSTEDRETFVKSLSEWEQKTIHLYEVRYGKVE